MSNKGFCESGKHVYKNRNVVRSVIEEDETLYIVVCCDKCDSKFLDEVERLL